MKSLKSFLNSCSEGTWSAPQNRRLWGVCPPELGWWSWTQLGHHWHASYHYHYRHRHHYHDHHHLLVFSIFNLQSLHNEVKNHMSCNSHYSSIIITIYCTYMKFIIVIIFIIIDRWIIFTWDRRCWIFSPL